VTTVDITVAAAAAAAAEEEEDHEVVLALPESRKLMEGSTTKKKKTKSLTVGSKLKTSPTRCDDVMASVAKRRNTDACEKQGPML
jgi:hypothetical protein